MKFPPLPVRLRKEGEYLQGAFLNWNRDDGPLMSAAVAYYLGLSLFPLMLVLISGFGMFLQYSDAGASAEQQIFEAVAMQLSPSLESNLKRAINEIKDRSTLTGPIGVAAILLASLAGIGWQLGRQILDFYLVRSHYGSAYGVVGSFIAIQLWCYYSVAIIFLGAEYIQEFCRHCHGEGTDESAGNQPIDLQHPGSGGRESDPPEKSEHSIQAN